jgi:hypothetical protein
MDEASGRENSAVLETTLLVSFNAWVRGAKNVFQKKRMGIWDTLGGHQFMRSREIV